MRKISRKTTPDPDFPMVRHGLQQPSRTFTTGR
jgi:hypothetical protein